MKIRNYTYLLLAFTLGLSLFALAGSRTLLVDGHCQASLAGIPNTDTMYLAITNTSTGKTIIHRFDDRNFSENEPLVFDAEAVNLDSLVIREQW